MEDGNLMALGIVLIVIGAVILFGLNYKNGKFDFIRSAHWWSLLIVVISGGLSWIATVWILSPDEFKPSRNQWISLGFATVISVVWWASYIYLVADESKENENS